MPHATSTLYEPHQRARMGWLGCIRALISNTAASKQLIWQLFKRDFLMQHKRSYFGMGWLVLAPLMGIVSWVLMNATGILNPGEMAIPYPAYLLISTSIWGLFMSFYSRVGETLQVSQAFIMQVHFCHDALIAKQFLQATAAFGISFIITIVALLFMGVVPQWPILLTPLFIIPLFLLGASIGLTTSVIKVVTPDLQRAITFVMGLLMYITPVIYSSDVPDPLLRSIMKWNPLTYLIGDFRDAIVSGTFPHPLQYFASVAVSGILFLVAWRIFFVSEHRVVERMI